GARSKFSALCGAGASRRGSATPELGFELGDAALGGVALGERALFRCGPESRAVRAVRHAQHRAEARIRPETPIRLERVAVERLRSREVTLDEVALDPIPEPQRSLAIRGIEMDDLFHATASIAVEPARERARSAVRVADDLDGDL